MARALLPCPYCHKFRERSNEHIFPDWLHKASPECEYTWSVTAQKIHKGQGRVGDVCKICNNGVLSDLDADVKTLWFARIQTFVLEGETATLAFDYDRLLRWLLKVGYNTGYRKAGQPRLDADAFAPLVPYIMEGDPRPEHVSVYLSLIKPTLMNGARVLPWPIRCSGFGFAGKTFRFCKAFVVALRSFQFLVTVKDKDYDAEKRLAEATEFAKLVTTSVPGEVLVPERPNVVLSTSHFDTLLAYGDHFTKHADRYKELEAIEEPKRRKQRSETHFVNLSIADDGGSARRRT